MALILRKNAAGELRVEGGNFPDEHNIGASFMKKGVEDGFIKLTMTMEFENGSAAYELYDFEAPDTFMFRKVGGEEAAVDDEEE